MNVNTPDTKMGETHIAGKSHQLWERLSRACQSIIGDVDG